MLKACVRCGFPEAIALLERIPVDLLILDVGLPDISGFELLKQLRKKSRSASDNADPKK